MHYFPGFDSIALEAQRRGISASLLGVKHLLLLEGFGRATRLFGTITERTSHLAVLLADDKRATKRLLAQYGLPTPECFAVDLEEEAVNAFSALGGRVALKPHNGSKGRGVTTAVATKEQVRSAFRLASKFSRVVLVERHHVGRDYRVLVIDGQVNAVVERRIPVVTGDGVRSVRELVEELNRDPRRGEGDEKPMNKIVIDDRMEEFLCRSDFSSSTVPGQGEVVPLSGMGSVSQGSVTVDHTDDIHPEIASVAIEATRAIGLDIAGVDLVARDISLPVKKSDAQIIEVNCSPGLRAHIHPGEGLARNPAAAIINYLFPESLAANCAGLPRGCWIQQAHSAGSAHCLPLAQEG